MTTPWILKCTDVPQYDALQAAAEEFQLDDKLHLRNLCSDSARSAGLTAVHMTEGFRKIILDYSRQQVTGETMELLFDLADAVGFTERRDAFRKGERINTTEDRAVLHHLLRMPNIYDLIHDGYVHSLADKILDDIHQVREKIHDFSERVRTSSQKGLTGKSLTTTLVIGAPGWHLGTEFIHEALAPDVRASAAALGRQLVFLTSVDPVEFFLTTKFIDAESTLVVVVSKDFHDVSVSTKLVREWLLKHYKERHNDRFKPEQIIAAHFCAVTNTVSQSASFGIPSTNIFLIWDWVVGRFSVCSAAGLLPLSLHYSYSIMEEVLAGAHDMDEHFFNAPLRDNIPVLLGLLGVWNSTFMGYPSRAILPFAQGLQKFSPYIQQIDMESNGKSVAVDGVPLLHHSGEVIFGEIASNSNHAFFQLLHQGRVVPTEFIGFIESPRPIKAVPGEIVPSHDEYMSNFFAQPDALAYGKTLVDLVQEGVPDGLREHMVFTGNRPSISLLLTKLDPFAVGQLLAIYEHRTASQGFLWGINSFDTFGVELGKLLAKHVKAQLSASRRTGASVQGFNLSTSSLLEAYLNHGKST